MVMDHDLYDLSVNLTNTRGGRRVSDKPTIHSPGSISKAGRRGYPRSSRKASQATVLSTLFHHFVPASLYGGQTVLPVLQKIDRELRSCGDNCALPSVIEGAKSELYGTLSSRFDPILAKALALKLTNVCLAGYHFRARHTGVHSRPIGLVVDPSNTCRLACPGCVHSERSEALKVFDWPNGTLSEERFSSLLRVYGPYAIGVYFCNYGEPLLNLRTPGMIRASKLYLAWTALSTSLSVQRFDADAYVESGLDFMVLSIDGATQPVYERFRRNGSLELVLANVRRIVEAKRRLRRKTPVLSWNFLAFEHNEHEIPAASRMARCLGVDQFRIVDPFDVSWDNPGIRAAESVKARVRRLRWSALANLPENWNPFPESLEAEAIVRAFDEPLCPSGVGEAASGQGHTCHWLYKNLVMDAMGRVLPCCGAPRPDADLVFARFDGSGDCFNSDKYRSARAFFSSGSVDPVNSPYCTRCDWDHTFVTIGGPEIRRYFRAADPALFDRRSLRLLSDW
jgi:MoaA/NifB/PqqE/SkfB family radical SAM enzyme